MSKPPATTSLTTLPGSGRSGAVLMVALLALASPAYADYTITKSFSPATVAAGEDSTLTITITHTAAGGWQLAEFDITDNYPTNLVNTGTATDNGNCGATPSASIGGTSLSISNGSINGNKTCTISVTVTSNVSDTYTNTLTTYFRETKGGSTRTSTPSPSADLTVTALAAPTVAKSFSPGTVAPNQSSTLEITLSNPNTAAINGLAFTDTFPSGMVLAGTPALSNGCGGSATTTSGSLSLSGGTLAGNSSCTVSVAVTAATANTYTNNTGLVTSDNAEDGASDSATLTVQSSADAFNAVATGADPVTGHLYTRISAQDFDFDLVALDGSSVATSFTGDVSVELVDNRSGGTCDDLGLVQDLGTRTFTALNAGRRNYSGANETLAWSDVKVRISYTDPVALTTITTCSTDSFAIRSQSLALSSSANTDPTGSSSTLTPIVAAGDTFTLTATAISGYNGTPEIDAAKVEAHTGAVVNGVIAGTFPAATGGASTGDFTYTEVGYFRLQAEGLYDDSFTAVDQPGDCTSGFLNSVDGSGLVGCAFGNASDTGYVGRFVPHHFDVAVDDTCATADFTYSGQAFTADVSARSSSATTQNYAGDFAKTVTLSRAVGSGGSFADATIASTAFAAGLASTTMPVFTFSTPPELPLQLFVRATDTDGVSSASGTEGDIEIRSGRLRLINAFGSGQAGLELPIRLESWQSLGTGTEAWATETGDSCTAALLDSGDFSSSWASTSANDFELFQSPDPNPGTGNVGLSAPSTAGSTIITAELDGVADWLQFDWDGDGDADNPRAQVGFEINPGNRRQIYTREVIGN